MVRMLAEDDYSENPKKILHKDVHGAKERNTKLLQQLFSCDDVKGDFDKDRKIGDSICGMQILK